MKSGFLRIFTRRWNQLVRACSVEGPRARTALLSTSFVCAIFAFGLAYFIYTSYISPQAEDNETVEKSVLLQEKDNERNRELERTEPQFRAEVIKAVDMYQEAQPMMPTSVEVGSVLSQVQAEATRNGVTLTGLSALKPETKATGMDKLYQREYPAVVTGTHAQVVRFFYAVSKLPRIVLISDFTETSLRQRVSVSFTLFAYNAPPPTEIPKLPEGFTAMQQPDPSQSSR